MSRVLVLRNTAYLASANLAAQGLGSLTHFLLAVWLTPSDYGVWASATALTAILAGLANFGEANRYLTGGTSLRDSLRHANMINAALACTTLVIAGASYAASRNALLFTLIVSIGLNIPILGASNLLYVALVHRRQQRNIVGGQLAGSVLKLLSCCAVAWTTQSPVAFVVGIWLNSVSSAWLYWRALRGDQTEALARTSSVAPVGRLRWGGQAVMSTLTAQVDYLVIFAVGTAQLLGLYFFAYQATVAVTALIAVPLTKIALSEFSQGAAALIPRLARELMLFIAFWSALAVLAVAVVIAAIGEDMLSTTWAPALPVISILLATIPARLMVPIVDAAQLARGQVTKNISINVLDAMGTGAAALTAISGDVMLVATAVAAWKMTISSVRVFFALGQSPGFRWTTALLPAGFGWASVGVSTSDAGYPGLVLVALVLAIFMVVVRAAGSASEQESTW